MPQQFLHYLEFGTDTSQQRRVRVPKSVPSESVLNSNLLRCRTNVFAHRLPPKRPSASITVAGENPVIELRVTGGFAPFKQSIGEHWMKGHGFLRRLSLARTHHTVHDGADDKHASLCKVDVSP